jgi:hypothetical protein
MLMFVVLSAGMLTALTVTTMSLVVPAFADKKKCEDNHNKNCNDKHKTQKVDQKNKCETENENNHHSKKNDNTNDHFCLNAAANLNDILLFDIFSSQDNVRTASLSENVTSQS